MLKALSTPHNRTVTFILLAACCTLALATAAVGVHDNLFGFFLEFLAASALVLAFVHPWRKGRSFFYLLLSSLLFAIVAELVEGFGDAAYSVALSLFPAAFLIGLAGWIALSVRDLTRKAHDRGVERSAR